MLASNANAEENSYRPASRGAALINDEKEKLLQVCACVLVRAGVCVCVYGLI